MAENRHKKIEAIRSLAPNIGFRYDDGGITNWYSSSVTQPTEAEIDAEVIRLQAIYDSQEYARKRKTKYEALNQFELISDDAINGTTTHKDAILAIKSEFPKP